MREPIMSRGRCHELLTQCRQDLNFAKLIGHQGWIVTLEARLQSLEDLRARMRGPAPTADDPQIVEAAA